MAALHPVLSLPLCEPSCECCRQPEQPEPQPEPLPQPLPELPEPQPEPQPQPEPTMKWPPCQARTPPREHFMARMPGLPPVFRADGRRALMQSTVRAHWPQEGVRRGAVFVSHEVRPCCEQRRRLSGCDAVFPVGAPLRP
jgi:hypothetical protein